MNTTNLLNDENTCTTYSITLPNSIYSITSSMDTLTITSSLEQSTFDFDLSTCNNDDDTNTDTNTNNNNNDENDSVCSNYSSLTMETYNASDIKNYNWIHCLSENDIDYIKHKLIDYIIVHYNDHIHTSSNETILLSNCYDYLWNELIKDSYEYSELYLYDDDYNEWKQEMVGECITFVTTYVYPPKSSNIVFHKNQCEETYTKIMYGLSQQVQYKQRSLEWYEQRSKMLTASDAYKIFGTQSMQNQLILSKCETYKTFNELRNAPKQQETLQTPQMVDESDDDGELQYVPIVTMNKNLYHPCEWGVRYEQCSIDLYEYINNTTIQEFGCMVHPKYSYIGASPDGINADKSNMELYGRMLEIKNPFSREISGKPKMEYWIQMQLQLEVCDLDECDFLETKMVEYDNFNDFKEDSESPELMWLKNKENKYKGLMLIFSNNGSPVYIYKPTALIDDVLVNKWIDEQINIHLDKNIFLYKTIYWRAEIYSCIVVSRNPCWFETHQHKFKEIFDIILEERDGDYSHRMPKKRLMADPPIKFDTGLDSTICMIGNDD